MITLDTDTETPAIPALMSAKDRRAYHEAHAARHFYESQWIQGMPHYHELSRASLHRCHNAVSIGLRSLDMDRIAREGR